MVILQRTMKRYKRHLRYCTLKDMQDRKYLNITSKNSYNISVCSRMDKIINQLKRA